MEIIKRFSFLLAALAASIMIAACGDAPEPTNGPRAESAVEAPAGAPNTLSEKEVEDGWMLLFDGESFAGWSEYNGAPADSVWRIDDGALMVLPGFLGESHDIVTDKSFENFELKLEWKVSPGANSGIFYLVQKRPEYDEAWKSSPEMQVLDDALHPDGQNRTHRAADLYDLIEADSAVANEVGEWNQVRIIVDGGEIQHWFNGRLVVSYELWTNEWNDLVARSKFSDLEHFAQRGRSHISLQEHDDRVWFRNIKIREL